MKRKINEFRQIVRPFRSQNKEKETHRKANRTFAEKKKQQQTKQIKQN